jgi:hypothetical protein
MRALRELDILGGSVNLSINGKDTFKTCTGVLNSILLMAGITFSVYYYINNYLDTSSPSIQLFEGKEGPF